MAKAKKKNPNKKAKHHLKLKKPKIKPTKKTKNAHAKVKTKNPTKSKFKSKKLISRKTPVPKLKKQKIPETKATQVQTLNTIESSSLRPKEQDFEIKQDLVASGIAPALDLLPDWEDRSRLKRTIFESGLTFHKLESDGPDFKKALMVLGTTVPESNRAGYFVICAKDKGGKIVGALDGRMLHSVLVVSHSHVDSEKKREIHILLYATSLHYAPSFVVSESKFNSLSVDSAARLIILGRGFGMHALKIGNKILLVRRVKNELYPIASGKEIASLLSELGDSDLVVAEFESKENVPLIPLPYSPDSREHLHELKDFAIAVGISLEKTESVFEILKNKYVLGRLDLTPTDLIV